MVQVKLAALLAVVGLAAHVSAQDKLNKPPLLPNLDMLWEGLEKKLTTPKTEIRQWRDNIISEDCKTMSEREGVPANSMIQYEVTYGDCKMPWLLCAAKDHPSNMKDIAKFFGMVPAKLRQATKHAAFFKPKTAKSTAAAYALGDQLAFMIDPKSIGIFLHEISHTADLGAKDSHFGKVEGRFTDNKIWTDAIQKDQAISDNYGQNSKHENLAQYAGLVLYDILVDGGLKKIVKDVDKIKNQIDAFKTATKECRWGGNMLKLDQTCSKRPPNAKPIDLGAKPEDKKDDKKDDKQGKGKGKRKLRFRRDARSVFWPKASASADSIEKRDEPTNCGLQSA
ncbi:hypothetical protein MCOR27_007328 [Pyricularia oryzae]|uniref:Uncharacterized protein n=1 Tax=Pyricularia grisea TaxID=148305 RepID=A0ABQ8NRB6_PYRGI|nr:hypothetical protein MCOR01_004878 [Pyricularia oryzae]KAI6301017.1 hypothetical protein MCOR33_003363 [Pyricularia grisea]KAH9431621.1 hypothetical protein MCOR02_008911 [Pyricularia oryzae]KAI6256705.1 hypothetical protein MCOR19_006821 [Pyricularia oryzae]KAI6274499.1 hypothetical protein MCOR26_006414 [Pyricularia oryzae]